MKQRVGALGQRQIPGMAELEMEQQRASEANAIEHLGEEVHAFVVRRPGSDLGEVDSR